jgi:hypothetical protein
MALQTTYPIGRSAPVCAVTGRSLASGEPIVAALVESAGGDLNRVDVSIEAWTAGARPAGAVFGFWRTTADRPEPKPTQAVSDEELIDLFTQLAEADGPRQRAFRYLLALVLIRKKLLVYEGDLKPTRSRPGGLRVRVRTRAAEEPMPVQDVIDPGLSPEQVAEASEDLGRVLGLSDPAQAPVNAPQETT